MVIRSGFNGSENGAKGGWPALVYGFDISDLKRAQESLQRAHDELEIPVAERRRASPNLCGARASSVRLEYTFANEKPRDAFM